jgi:hypothetical protein
MLLIHPPPPHEILGSSPILLVVERKYFRVDLGRVVRGSSYPPQVFEHQTCFFETPNLTTTHQKRINGNPTVGIRILTEEHPNLTIQLNHSTVFKRLDIWCFRGMVGGIGFVHPSSWLPSPLLLITKCPEVPDAGGKKLFLNQ